MGMITATQSLSKSYLPPDARLLVVGAGSVGKSALAKAIQRLAKRVRVHAETHALPHSLITTAHHQSSRSLFSEWHGAALYCGGPRPPPTRFGRPRR